MATSAAHIYAPIGTSILSALHGQVSNDTSPHIPDMRATSSANQAVADDGMDRLTLNPYAITLKQRIFTKLEAGLDGEALELILKGLENSDELTTKTLMSDIADEALNAGYNDFAFAVQDMLRNNNFDFTPAFSLDTPQPTHAAPNVAYTM